jgi:hypothetical protein
MDVTMRASDNALRQLLSRQLDVITRHQALTAGVTASSLRHRLGPGGSWQSLMPGVYLAATGTPTVVQQQMAAMLYAGRGSVITGSAALQQHRIRGPAADLIEVLIPASRRRQDTAFVRLHRTTRMPKRIWRFGPLHYTLPARAVADTVRGLTGLRDAQAIVADAVQRGACTVPDLSKELSNGPSVGSKLFREALADVADGIRSAAEGDLKHLLTKSGLPMPLFNASIYDEGDGSFVARPDAWWPQFGVAVEVDSHEWHMSPQDHARTLERQRRMGQYGIIVLPFTPSQIRKQPAEVLATIRHALDNGRPQTSLRTVPADHGAAA